jgi:hypothetical protein
VASFNPIYGQGMSVAALEAMALAENLDAFGNDARLPHAMAAATSKIVDSPWQIATGTDFIYPRTTGRRPPGINAINRYLTQVITAAAVDREVSVAFSRVQQLLDAPSSLLKPSLVAKVRRVAKKPRRRSSSPGINGVTGAAHPRGPTPAHPPR